VYPSLSLQVDGPLLLPLLDMAERKTDISVPSKPGSTLSRRDCLSPSIERSVGDSEAIGVLT